MKCITLIALVVIVSCEVKEEDDVIVVTQANWDEVVTPDATVLVEFCKNNFLLYIISQGQNSKFTNVPINLTITPFAVVVPF